MSSDGSGSEASDDSPPPSPTRSTAAGGMGGGDSSIVLHASRKAGEARPSSEVLLSKLQSEVRRTFEARRLEYDRTHYELTQKKKELERMRMQLQDLARDGRALGVLAGVDGDGGEETVARVTISKRSVVVSDTRLLELEDTLEERREQLRAEEHKAKVYDHMRERLQKEKVDMARHASALRRELASQQAELAEMEKAELAASESLASQQAALASTKSAIREEMREWRRELAERSEWMREKGKFEEYYRKQMHRQQQLEKEVKGELDRGERLAKSSAVAGVTGSSSLELTESLEMTLSEEKRFEEAFRKIGVKLGELDPNEVIKMCLAQDEIKKDLERRRAVEEERITDLRQRLADCQQELQNAMFGSERTTNRMLDERERLLNNVEKKLEVEKSEYEFMRQIVQPVKIGIQHIAKKVLNMSVDVGDVSQIEWALESIQLRLSKLIKDIRAVMDAAKGGSSSSSSPVGSAGDSGVLLMPSASAPALLKDAESLLSPFNIRIKPPSAREAEEALESEKGTLAATMARLSGGKLAVSLTDSVLATASDSDSDDDIIDRRNLKKLSTAVVTEFSRPSRHGRSHGSSHSRTGGGSGGGSHTTSSSGGGGGSGHHHRAGHHHHHHHHHHSSHAHHHHSSSDKKSHSRPHYSRRSSTGKHEAHRKALMDKLTRYTAPGKAEREPEETPLTSVSVLSRGRRRS